MKKLNSPRSLSFNILLFSLFFIFSKCNDDDSINLLTADFSANSLTINAGQTIEFSDATMGTPVSWAWTFQEGDPPTSVDQNKNVCYYKVGNFDVTLTVTDASGNSNSITKTAFVTVNEIPIEGTGGVINCKTFTPTNITAVKLNNGMMVSMTDDTYTIELTTNDVITGIYNIENVSADAKIIGPEVFTSEGTEFLASSGTIEIVTSTLTGGIVEVDCRYEFEATNLQGTISRTVGTMKGLIF